MAELRRWTEKRGIQPFGTSLGICPDQPPVHEPESVYARAGWWGTADWLVRGEPPIDADPLPDGTPEKYLDLLPGEPATIGPPRWDESDSGVWALHPVCPGYALNPVYFAYAAAASEADEWRAVRSDHLRYRGESIPDAPLIIGLKQGEPVALLPVVRTRSLEGNSDA